MKTVLKKFNLCDQCFSVGIRDTDCICSYGKYKTIELEFETCKCCGRFDDGEPADTDFNKEQIAKLGGKQWV